MRKRGNSVAAGSCAYIRRHLNAGVTVVSATAVVVGLVVAPPSDVDGAGSEVRSVQLAAIALPSVAGAPGGLTTPVPPGLLRAASSLAPSLDVDALPSAIDDLFPGGVTQYVVVAFLIPVLVVLFPVAVVYTLVQDFFYLLQNPTAAASTQSVPEKASATAEPLDPIEFVVDNVRTLGDGLGKSAGVANSALPNLALLPFVTAFFSLLAPQQIPTVISLAAEGLDSFWNGVRYPNGFGFGTNLGYDAIVPGFYIPTDTDPTLSGRHAEAYSGVVDGTILPATVQAINRVSRNLTAAGVPKVVEQTLLSLEKITITVQQARVLVRGATVSAIQDVISTATSGGDVGKAVGDGFTGVRDAILGDPDAPDAHVDPFDDTSETAPSIRQLGALGSVAASVKKAVNGVTNTGLVKTTVGEKTPQVGERTITRSADVDYSTAANPTRHRPIRDAVRQTAKEIRNVVNDVRAGVKKALSGGRSDDSAKTAVGEGETS